MMNNRVCYRKIRTYTDLRIERMRVDRELDSLGERLKADWRGISQMFSMGYLVDRITGRASQMYAFVQWGMSAYSQDVYKRQAMCCSAIRNVGSVATRSAMSC